jgi:YidC/Oxa1 family membrane protein insertase
VRNDYLINVEYLIENNSNRTWEGFFYGQLKRDNSQDPSAKKNKSMGLSPFLGIATSTTEDRFKKIKFKDLDDSSENFTKEGGWISILQHYFLTAWIPDQNKTNNYTALKTDSGFYIARFTQPKTIVEPQQSKSIKAGIYIGPKDQYRLEEISEGLDLSVDYGILWWIAQPLFALLHFFALGELHIFGKTFSIGSGLGNWGFSIILLTVCVKLIFYKLSAASYRSMANMRKVQPKLEMLKARYGDDKQKMSQELMALYKKEKINPLGGCLPILVQMPVFLSLYWVLLESVELRHAPFIGYIQDLSAMDPYFILPLLMGATMFVQQQLNPTPPDPIQAKVMKFLPIIFTFFFLFFPAGLVLYWVVNSLLSILQQWWITRAIERAST